MEKVNVGLIVRTYEEDGGFYETRRDHISCTYMSQDMMKDLISGEVIGVQITTDAEAFYFKVPDDWPENWTTLKDSHEKQFVHKD